MIPTLSNKHAQVAAVHPAEFLAKVKNSDIKANLARLWDMPYPADPILEADYVGLTYGRVAQLRQVQLAALGNGDAFDRVVDRMIGKAAQVNLNANLSGSYKDFLKQVAEEEEAQAGLHANASEGEIIDTEIVDGSREADQIA